MKSPQIRMAGVAITLVAGLFAASLALAQPAPEAGQILEQLKKPAQPQPAPTELIIKPGSAETAEVAGGAQVQVDAVTLQGMTRFDETTLLAALGDYRGQSFDLAGLRGLAERITRFYRAHGYPVALAYLPTQTLKDGVLVIAIVEGTYGAVRTAGDPELEAGAQAFLAGLRSGEVIEGPPLERAIHLLGDQPGVVLSPVLMPGAAVGSGDLEVRVAPGKRFAVDLGLDNHGNRYTGAWRSSATLGINRALTFGDQLTLGVMLSGEEEKFWYGRIGYALPLGGSGLRGRIDYLRTDYELGGAFASLGASGQAGITTLGLEYPLVRALRGNLLLKLDYQHKSLDERPGNLVPHNHKTSDALPLALHFDKRDSLAGGGLTWGVLSWTPGRLSLDDSLQSIDRATAQTEGGFHRVNLELARLQQLAGPLSLYGRFNSQWTNDNLDSSEGFGLGGANGVRAYPQGEAQGDRGWLGQVELRYAAGPLAPYLFYDGGEATINAAPWSTGDNHRNLAGGGIGLRATAGGFSLDASAAWRATGGLPESDTRDAQPRVWVSAHYRF